MTPRGTGYLPDPDKKPGDAPDWDFAQLRAFRGLGQTAGPTDLRHLVVSVLDQGSIGSCVANAGFQAVRMVHRARGIHRPPLASRLFGYLVARTYIGTEKADTGCHPRDFFRGLNKYGFLPENQYPYDVRKFADRPNPQDMTRAHDQRDKGDTIYVRISSYGLQKVQDICTALDNGFPVVFGADVNLSFCRLEKRFQIFDPPARGEQTWGHAMCLVGHGIANGRTDTVTAVGSWGEGSHDEGYHHFTFDYAERFRDVWVVERAPAFSGSAA